jgi:arabinan endo-1,5-alpha-L-arabinosidase
MLSRTILLTATALASATAVVGFGSTAQAATDTVHVYQFVNAHHSNKDLAVLNASTAPGQPIVQFSRNTGANQQWEIVNLPSTPAPGFAPDRQLRNRLSGLCLDVDGNSLSAGATIVQNPCDPGDPAQRWIVPKVAEIFSTNGGFRHYVNKNSGLAMDVAGGSTANNAPIIQFPSHGGVTNQLFQQVFAGASSD